MYSSVVFFLFFFCSSAVVNGWPKLFAWFPETCCSHRRIRHRGHFVYETNIPPCCLLPRQPSTSSVCCHPTDWMPVSSCPIGFLSTIFEQFSAILLFAVAGTIFNAICIGIQHFQPMKSDKTSFSGLFSYIKVLAFGLADGLGFTGSKFLYWKHHFRLAYLRRGSSDSAGRY